MNITKEVDKIMFRYFNNKFHNLKKLFLIGYIKSNLLICLTFHLIVIIFFTSCKQSFKDINQYYHWMDDKENGLVIKRSSGDKELTMKYLAVPYLVYNDVKDIENPSKVLIDSLTRVYSNSRNFLLTIRSTSHNEDIMLEGVTNEMEYNQKNLVMNFGISEYLTLKTDIGNSYFPALVNMENTYGLQKHKNFYIVFAPMDENEKDIMTSQTLDVVFDDRIFSTGINHFLFEKEKLDQEITIKITE